MVKKTVKELTLHVEGDTQFVDVVFMDGSEREEVAMEDQCEVCERALAEDDETRFCIECGAKYCVDCQNPDALRGVCSHCPVEWVEISDSPSS